MERKSKIILVVSVIILIYITGGIFVKFSRGVDYATIGSEYKDARTYMGLAWVINNDIEFRSMIFGTDNIINKPFYVIRDILFNIGYSKYPKEEEAEKEFWWYKIKFVDYENKTLACGTASNSSTCNDLVKINNELYKHIDTFALAKSTPKTNNEFASQKLLYFIKLVKSYYRSTSTLNIRKEIEKQRKSGDVKKIIYLSNEDRKKYEHVYNVLDNFVNYSKTHEKETYEQYSKFYDFSIRDDALKFYILTDILESKLYNNELNCDDKYVKIFADEHRTIRRLFYPNGDYTRPSKSSSTLDGTLAQNVNILLAYKCKNSPYMKDYIQYCLFALEDRNKRWSNSKSNNAKTIDEVKDEIINNYKRDKEYDKLKQLSAVGIK